MVVQERRIAEIIRMQIKYEKTINLKSGIKIKF
jgi:hypothetical protein